LLLCANKFTPWRAAGSTECRARERPGADDRAPSKRELVVDPRVDVPPGGPGALPIAGRQPEFVGERLEDVPGFHRQAPARYPQRIRGAGGKTIPPTRRVATEVSGRRDTLWVLVSAE
jgi:hypothetical protein